MNIEELELSLRTEFEGQIRNVLAGIKQEVDEFQKKFEAEFEKHRSELDRTINELSEKLPQTSAFDAAFTESVNEHLRLARDDGAQVAATAFGEAEKLKAETEAAAPASYDLIRNAIADISSKTTQATILQELVNHAAHFAARGAFFIVKNEYLVGWKVFGAKVSANDARVRDIHFPASTDSVLSASVRTMSIATAGNGEHSGDKVFLDALDFGRPDQMFAIPLTARGRGVAVLYADNGDGGVLNIEALETLVRVAGLTVELLAASQAAHAPVVQPVQQEAVQSAPEAATLEEYDEVPTAEEPIAETEYSTPQVESSLASLESPSAEDVADEAAETVEEYTGEVSFEAEPAAEFVAETEAVVEPEVETFQPVAAEETVDEVVYEAVGAEESYEPVTEPAFSADDSYDDAHSAPAEVVEEAFVPMVEAPASVNGNGHVAVVEEPMVEVATVQPTKSRLSDRNVDLPIEVADDERRLHNDARRFARLLVSEIKLYNEQKVTEGRESGDLYDRLRDAIDRSREMYDKRVQPAVASKFDYFHYELVNSLADGVDAKLGGSYPGAAA